MLAWDLLATLSNSQRGRFAQIVGGHHGLFPRTMSLNIHHVQALGEAAQVDAEPPPELESARRWLWDVRDAQVGVMPDVEMPTPTASDRRGLFFAMPTVATAEGLRDRLSRCIERGAPIEPKQNEMPPLAHTRSVFGAAVPVSYPNPEWASELVHISGGWDGTLVARAQQLDVIAGECRAGDWTLRSDEELGLVVTKERS